MANQLTDIILLHPLSFSLLLLLLLLFLIKYLISISPPTTKLPPSPPRLPILGNLHQLGSLPHRTLQSLAQRHGPLLLLHLGHVPTLLVSSAHAAREVMKTHDIIFSNRPKLRLAEKLLYDLKDVSMAPYGEYWRQLKTICVLQLLSTKRVQSFRALREEETALMMKKIKELEIVNLSEMFKSLMNDVVCRVALGRKYSEGESGKRVLWLFKDFLVLLGSISVGDFIPWLGWVSKVNGFDGKVDRVAKELDDFLEGVIEEHMDSLETEESDGREDFVDTLLKIQKDDVAGISIDRDGIKALILDIFSAGTDTSATVLEWVMTELLRHPKIMQNVKNEVRIVLNGKQNITEDDLEKMQYLKAVIKESLRLHPPIPLLVREASQDVKVMGYDIAAGTMVIINTWAIGRDPESWDNPKKFHPERFLGCSVDFKGHDFQLIPFGAGRRGCPGIAFAMVTIELVLANLVQKFDWELPNGAKGEDLNISECPGTTACRKVPLLAVATPCSC